MEEKKVEEIKNEETIEEIEKENDESGEVEEEKEEIEKVEEEEEVDIEKLGPEDLPETKKDDDDDDDDIDVEDKARISKVVDDKVKTELAKAAELNTFLRKHPEFVKYEEVITKYKNHPNYKNVPINGIAAIVSSKDAQKIGADKEAAAHAKANKTKSPGESVRKVEAGGTDWSKASAEDFATQRAKVFGHN